MFGYLIASADKLTEEELGRYKSCYCGLCRSLKERHGQISRLTLNYDMTFLVLLLESLYEPEESVGCGPCLAHPRGERSWWRSEVSDYAADMNLALGYLSSLDDWEDESSLRGLAASGVLKKKYQEVKEQYPSQCAAMEQSIFQLHTIEGENSDNADAAAATFGRMMGEIFVFRGDRWSDTLYAFGDSLGRFIYLMDAVCDLDKDTYKNNYNPFRKYYGSSRNAEFFREILKIYLADAVYEFEKLPLVQDAGLMKNILCSGLWSRFEEKYGSIQGPRSES